MILAPLHQPQALIKGGARMAGLFKSGAMGDPDIVTTLAELFEKMWNEKLKTQNKSWIQEFCWISCWIHVDFLTPVVGIGVDF